MNELCNELCEPLSILFNTSLRTTEVPTQWQEARVSAIFKKGKTNLACNYRPVSITCIICRVMETIIRDHITSYLVKHNLLSKYQFGFLKGKSTTLQLLNVLNDWTQTIEDKCSTDCLYMDYQKAFDTVPHKRLLSKLKSYNINKEILDWISVYLNNRLQFVEVNGKRSKWLQVTSGIPQGSVLGPLLFLIYINDLPEKIDSTVYMYADDTKLYREIKCIDDNKKLQEDLNELKKWSDLWLLKFHPDKCFRITIGKKKEYEFEYYITVENKLHEMSKVDEIRDIGVIIDSELKFEKHINSKIQTANKILGIIRRSFMYLNCDIFIPLYKSLIRSHFDYAMIIWSPNLGKFIDSIESVQRRATKMIPEIKNLSYPERLKYLNLPTLAYRRARGDMIEVFKIISNIYNSNSTEQILTIRDKKHISLRGHQFTLDHNRLYTSARKRYFGNRVTNTWNSLPDYIVGAFSLNVFKNLLDILWSRQELWYNYKANINKKDYFIRRPEQFKQK